MRFSLSAMGISGGILWGAAILMVRLINLTDSRYGVNFLQMTSSAYPGFTPLTRCVAF